MEVGKEENEKKRSHGDALSNSSKSKRSRKGISSTSYRGFTFASTEAGSRGYNHQPEIDRVDASTWFRKTSEKVGGGDAFPSLRFFETYVAARRPCVITNWPSATSLAPPSYERVVRHLTTSTDAASATVAVEEREDAVRGGGGGGNKFGRGRRVPMAVREFFRSDALATQRYYLSTQEAPEHHSHHQKGKPPPPFYGPPCDRLRDAHLLPNLSEIAGHLRLSSCNLWVGCCGTGDAESEGETTTTTTTTSTGLHHDFHDNLYCLVAGRKRFRLYAPTEARHLGIADATLHPNGLLSYRPTRGDGVPLPEERAGGGKGDKCHEAKDDNQDDEKKKVADGADDIDEGEEEEEEEVVWGKGFDYRSSDDDGEGNDDVGDATGVAAAASKVQDEVVFVEEKDDDDDDSANEDANGDDDSDDNNTNELPKHFSWIDPTAASKESIAQTFPAFAKTIECIVELQAGDILYLPASWFHCVTSMGSEDHRGAHMAINFWYHPPDNLSDFEHPYQDRDYWEQESEPTNGSNKR